ncbi:MAG: DISARM system helicase DrmA [Bryobacteraceae bacterium]
MTSAEVRTELVNALKLDLVGPGLHLGDPNEALPQPPSRWYLTGFLVPRDTAPEQSWLADADDDFDQAEKGGLDDDIIPDRSSTSKVRRLPSSMGLSFLVPAEAKTLTVQVRWGEYRLSGEPNTVSEAWKRTPRAETVTLKLGPSQLKAKEEKVPNSDGMRLATTIQPVGSFGADAGMPPGARTVSVFLVNNQQPVPDSLRDQAFAFQTELDIAGDAPFLPRPDMRGVLSNDWDERLADLQYADTGEYAVGHNISALASVTEGVCRRVYICWVPDAQVERIAPSTDFSERMGMEALAALKDGAEARARLMPLVDGYRAWIARQPVKQTPRQRQETARELLKLANVAADRIQVGIGLLDDPECFAAFCITNRAMATAARRRQGVMRGLAESAIPEPKWRPFQLAFLLMNLPGIVNPQGDDRKTVDLLFFPTGGGKTEAYLALAAFTLVLRRMRGALVNSGHGGAGVSVLMRYTLRLLTLDQLSRAATLICALELEREQSKVNLGSWPFEIGLWVGRAATPNEMGSKDRDHPDTARRRTITYQNDDRRPSPIPLEECPWCGTKFTRASFRLTANGKSEQHYPTDLQIGCVNRACPFSAGRPLPIVAVDEPIYRRLPCFVIATVDKFAGMPWTGPVGALFGRVDRYDNAGFYGPCDPSKGAPLPEGRLLPPDLIIQDELHLISGPLGTMVGLYETALEELACLNGVRPKIVASTATVRKADSQIRALFDRARVDIFPPPGPNRRDSFFAKTLTPDLKDEETNARLYLGIAAQGVSAKVIMLRVYLALLGAAQKWYDKLRSSKQLSDNPADPYMTLLGYFNALRELGGARRVIEDEVRNRLLDYDARRRVGEAEGLFSKREIAYEPVELTSREDTAKIATAKARLDKPFTNKERVDVAIATNMISVGLDITRLGLMVIFGQPKTSAEYIQTSSRVGRNPKQPGLVVTILNANRPRDRSHYERFAAYHQTFYRSVEATSVTPFSPRALDRGLAAAVVALARLESGVMTPPRGAMEILQERNALSSVADRFSDRAYDHNSNLPLEDRNRTKTQVRQRIDDLLDRWALLVQDQQKDGASLHYNPHERGAGTALLQDFLDPDLKSLPPGHWRIKFRANRSMRDVEPTSALWVRDLSGIEIVGDEV